MNLLITYKGTEKYYRLMSYSSDPQAIVYHPEISPKQTDTHFKTMISFFSTQAILEGKKLTIKKAKSKNCKKQIGRRADCTCDCSARVQKQGCSPLDTPKCQQQPNILPSHGHYSAWGSITGCQSCSAHPNQFLPPSAVTNSHT